jgi:rod shape-determining protein MreC
MRDFLRRIRLPLVFTALLLLTTTLMVVDRRTVLEGGSDHSWLSGVLIEIAAPIQKLIRLPVDLLGETWTDYIALVDLRRQNETLSARLAALEEENLQFREALVASGNLERIVQMRESFEVPLLPSEVVGQDVSPWFRSILLDRGRSHEVLSGMPVVSDHGVVGLVTATSPHASRAMMLLDRQSAVDAIVQRSRARGIVRGKGTGDLEFVFMVRGDDVQPGDVLITSGVGGVYPKGLRIGAITAVRTEEARLLHTGSVRPSVDFGRIEQVFIMLQRGPTMDLLYAGEGDEIGVSGEAEAAKPSP